MTDHNSLGASAPSPAKNFSVGDVVVCVDDSPRYLPVCGVTRGLLYTVVEADNWGGGPGVRLAEACPTAPAPAFYCDRFRLAYTPDPEVEREAVRDPLTVPGEPKRRVKADACGGPNEQ